MLRPPARSLDFRPVLAENRGGSTNSRAPQPPPRAPRAAPPSVVARLPPVASRPTEHEARRPGSELTRRRLTVSDSQSGAPTAPGFLSARQVAGEIGAVPGGGVEKIALEKRRALVLDSIVPTHSHSTGAAPENHTTSCEYTWAEMQEILQELQQVPSLEPWAPLQSFGRGCSTNEIKLRVLVHDVHNLGKQIQSTMQNISMEKQKVEEMHKQRLEAETHNTDLHAGILALKAKKDPNSHVRIDAPEPVHRSDDSHPSHHMLLASDELEIARIEQRALLAELEKVRADRKQVDAQIAACQRSLAEVQPKVNKLREELTAKYLGQSSSAKSEASTEKRVETPALTVRAETPALTVYDNEGEMDLDMDGEPEVDFEYDISLEICNRASEQYRPEDTDVRIFI